MVRVEFWGPLYYNFNKESSEYWQLFRPLNYGENRQETVTVTAWPDGSGLPRRFCKSTMHSTSDTARVGGSRE